MQFKPWSLTRLPLDMRLMPRCVSYSSSRKRQTIYVCYYYCYCCIGNMPFGWTRTVIRMHHWQMQHTIGQLEVYHCWVIPSSSNKKWHYSTNDKRLFDLFEAKEKNEAIEEFYGYTHLQIGNQNWDRFGSSSLEVHWNLSFRLNNNEWRKKQSANKQKPNCNGFLFEFVYRYGCMPETRRISGFCAMHQSCFLNFVHEYLAAIMSIKKVIMLQQTKHTVRNTHETNIEIFQWNFTK